MIAYSRSWIVYPDGVDDFTEREPALTYAIGRCFKGWFDCSLLAFRGYLQTDRGCSIA